MSNNAYYVIHLYNINRVALLFLSSKPLEIILKDDFKF